MDGYIARLSGRFIIYGQASKARRDYKERKKDERNEKKNRDKPFCGAACGGNAVWMRAGGASSIFKYIVKYIGQFFASCGVSSPGRPSLREPAV